MGGLVKVGRWRWRKQHGMSAHFGVMEKSTRKLCINKEGDLLLLCIIKESFGNGRDTCRQIGIAKSYTQHDALPPVLSKTFAIE